MQTVSLSVQWRPGVPNRYTFILWSSSYFCLFVSVWGPDDKAICLVLKCSAIAACGCSSSLLLPRFVVKKTKKTSGGWHTQKYTRSVNSHCFRLANIQNVLFHYLWHHHLSCPQDRHQSSSNPHHTYLYPCHHLTCVIGYADTIASWKWFQQFPSNFLSMLHTTYVQE